MNLSELFREGARFMGSLSGDVLMMVMHFASRHNLDQIQATEFLLIEALARRELEGEVLLKDDRRMIERLFASEKVPRKGWELFECVKRFYRGELEAVTPARLPRKKKPGPRATRSSEKTQS